jgi:uncharacterized membrane protein
MAKHLSGRVRSLLWEAGLVLAGGLLLLGLIGWGEAGEGLSLMAQMPRLALGVVYVLYVPGYLLQAALFPQRSDLDGPERVGLSLGLSVALIPLLALLLDALPWGLRLWPIVLGQLGMIGFLLLVESWRRLRLPAGQAYEPALRWQPGLWWASLSVFDRRLYLFLAGALIAAGGAAAWVFLVSSDADFMTEFYMLGRGGLAEDYPRRGAVGELLEVTLGVKNLERSTLEYRMEAWAVDPWSGGRRALVGQSEPFTLEVGQQRSWTQAWAMPWPGDDQQVEFLLFRAGDEAPYRRLLLWLDVTD